MDYSLADLVKLSGAKRRTVQLLAEGGVIQALPETERQGTGTHRRFDRKEAIIACLLHGFSRQAHMPIGVLLRISRLLRDSLNNRADFQYSIERAIKNESNIYLILRGSGAPKFVISFGDGSVHDKFEVGVVDSAAGGEGVFKKIGHYAADHLGHYGSSSHIILANTYLEELE